MDTWILTFDRPLALNRQIAAFAPWTDVKIFSNHPEVQLSPENNDLYKGGRLPVLYNTLSDPEATSYCARSWNSIFLKAFKTEEFCIFAQDDTMITNPDGLKEFIITRRNKYDMFWFPGGDQFFAMSKSVLKTVGFFDERFPFCYCGDACFLKRVWQKYDRSRLCIAETHDWGFHHNAENALDFFRWDVQSKAIDQNYANQHWDAEKLSPQNNGLIAAQKHWEDKWAHPLNGVGSFTQFDTPPRFPEIQWYPWFDAKYLNDGPRKNGVYG